MHPIVSAKGMLKGAGLALSLAVLPGLVAAQDTPGEGVTVTPARATWDTGWFPAAVYSRLLEELGYETVHRSPGYSNHSHSDPDWGAVDVVYVDGEAR